MSHIYDNWGKLVGAVLRREELRALALRQSMDTISSISDGDESSSIRTSFSSSSSIRDDESLQRIQLPVDYSDLMTNHTDWKSMLPPGQNEIVWNSASLSFSLEKRSGKNCFMVGAKGLIGKTKCVPYSKSRFSEVARLKDISDLSDIRGVIEKQRLSPNTVYGACLVFKLTKLSHDFGVIDESDIYESDIDESDIYESDIDESDIDESVYVNVFESAIATIKFVDDEEGLHHTEQLKMRRKFKTVSRVDGWKEIEMGDFYVDSKPSGKVEAWLNSGSNTLLELYRSTYICPIVEAIEFRPIDKSLLVQLPVDFSNLMSNRTEWKSLPENNQVVWKSAPLSFYQHKRSEKIYFMVGPRGLLGRVEYFPYRESRFSEVALLKGLTDIQGKIEKQSLSPNTIYGAYLVFKLVKLYDSDVEHALLSAIATLRFVDDDDDDDYVDEEQDHTEQRSIRYKLKAVSRGDGWMEIKMGEFYIDNEKQSGKVEARFETNKLLELNISKMHLLVEGIEFRPMVDSTDFSRPRYKISRLFGNLIWKTRKEEGRNV